MMEGRGVPVSVAAAMPANSSGATAAQAKIRRKHPATGTKRKAISSVVASSQRQAKKHANGNGPVGVAIAPALAPYVFPAPASAADGAVPSTTTAQGTISGPALEDSLYVKCDICAVRLVTSTCSLGRLLMSLTCHAPLSSLYPGSAS